MTTDQPISRTLPDWRTWPKTRAQFGAPSVRPVIWSLPIARRRRFWMGPALLLFLSSAAFAGPLEAGRGFGFCASPLLPPQCVNAVEVYGDDARVKNCQDEISRYVATIVAYRQCTARQADILFLETNAVLDRFKCGVKLKRACP